MRLEWKTVSGVDCTGDVCAHLLPYVNVIGLEAAAQFFLAFGGADLYLPTEPKSRSPIVPVIGVDKTRALAAALGAGHIQVPTAKKFLARHLRGKNSSTADIARQLHVTRGIVRRWLQPDSKPSSSN